MPVPVGARRSPTKAWQHGAALETPPALTEASARGRRLLRLASESVEGSPLPSPHGAAPVTHLPEAQNLSPEEVRDVGQRQLRVLEVRPQCALQVSFLP